MRAAQAIENEVRFVDVPIPEPSAGEALVKVTATAVNRADLMQVRGNYPPPAGASETLGLELAGEVVEIPDADGHRTSGPTPGDRVMALVAGGAYAEYASVPIGQLMPIPPNLSYAQAAAIPEVFLTAYSNMVEIGRLSTGERVLIHAGASGVGLAATQIARDFGATVYSTASAAKHAVCYDSGASLVIDYKIESFADRILETTSGVHLIVDMVGPTYWGENMRVIEQWGRIVYIGMLGGSLREVDFSVFLGKRLSVHGSTLRNRSTEEKAGLVERFWRWAEPRFASGVIVPNIHRVMPLDAVREAHELVARNENAGKVVLEVG